MTKLDSVMSSILLASCQSPQENIKVRHGGLAGHILTNIWSKQNFEKKFQSLYGATLALYL